jgi:hypothetical protein
MLFVKGHQWRFFRTRFQASKADKGGNISAGQPRQFGSIYIKFLSLSLYFCNKQYPFIKDNLTYVLILSLINTSFQFIYVSLRDVCLFSIAIIYFD